MACRMAGQHRTRSQLLCRYNKPWPENELLSDPHTLDARARCLTQHQVASTKHSDESSFLGTPSRTLLRRDLGGLCFGPWFSIFSVYQNHLDDSCLRQIAGFHPQSS